MIIWPPILGSQISELQREQQSNFQSDVWLGESTKLFVSEQLFKGFTHGRRGDTEAISVLDQLMLWGTEFLELIVKNRFPIKRQVRGSCFFDISFSEISIICAAIKKHSETNVRKNNTTSFNQHEIETCSPTEHLSGAYLLVVVCIDNKP